MSLIIILSKTTNTYEIRKNLKLIAHDDQFILETHTHTNTTYLNCFLKFFLQLVFPTFLLFYYKF